MAKGIRIQPVIPQIAYDQLMQEVEVTGLSASHIISHLLIKSLPKLRNTPNTDPHKQLNALRKQIKPLVEMSNAGTITQNDAKLMADLAAQIKAIKEQLGMGTTPEEVQAARAQYDDTSTRLERETLQGQLTAMHREYQELTAKSRTEGLDADDQYRLKELMVFIARTQSELDQL